MTRADISAELDAMIGPGNPLTGAQKAMFINDAYLYMIDCFTAANPDYFTKAATLKNGTLSGQQQYDIPDDFEKATMVNIKQNGVWRRARPMHNQGDVPVLARTDTSQGFSEVDPWYYIFGKQIGFMPIPTDSTGNIKLWYVYAPGELTTDSSVPVFPATYHHLIKYGAYANFLDQDDQHGAAEAMRNRFQQRIDKMIETMYENQTDEPKSIVVNENQELYIDDYLSY